MSRAFGDTVARRIGVTAVPEQRSTPLGASDRFLVLASDGVWDAMTNQEAAAIVTSGGDARQVSCRPYRPLTGFCLSCTLQLSYVPRAMSCTCDAAWLTTLKGWHWVSECMHGSLVPWQPRCPCTALKRASWQLLLQHPFLRLERLLTHLPNSPTLRRYALHWSLRRTGAGRRSGRVTLTTSLRLWCSCRSRQDAVNEGGSEYENLLYSTCNILPAINVFTGNPIYRLIESQPCSRPVAFMNADCCQRCSYGLPGGEHRKRCTASKRRASDALGQVTSSEQIPAPK